MRRQPWNRQVLRAVEEDDIHPWSSVPLPVKVSSFRGGDHYKKQVFFGTLEKIGKYVTVDRISLNVDIT